MDCILFISLDFPPLKKTKQKQNKTKTTSLAFEEVFGV